MRSFVYLTGINLAKYAKLSKITGVLHKFRPIAEGLIIRQADFVFSRGRNGPRPVIMPCVSRRGLNFDLNASQYGVHNSAPTISFAFTRQMNHARARKIVEFTFLTTEHVRPRRARREFVSRPANERSKQRKPQRSIRRCLEKPRFCARSI